MTADHADHLTTSNRTTIHLGDCNRAAKAARQSCPIDLLDSNRPIWTRVEVATETEQPRIDTNPTSREVKWAAVIDGDYKWAIWNVAMTTIASSFGWTSK
jgi:hypothetical protein